MYDIFVTTEKLFLYIFQIRLIYVRSLRARTHTRTLV